MYLNKHGYDCDMFGPLINRHNKYAGHVRLLKESKFHSPLFSSFLNPRSVELVGQIKYTKWSHTGFALLNHQALTLHLPAFLVGQDSSPEPHTWEKSVLPPNT